MTAGICVIQVCLRYVGTIVRRGYREEGRGWRRGMLDDGGGGGNSLRVSHVCLRGSHANYPHGFLWASLNIAATSNFAWTCLAQLGTRITQDANLRTGVIIR